MEAARLRGKGSTCAQDLLDGEVQHQAGAVGGGQLVDEAASSRIPLQLVQPCQLATVACLEDADETVRVEVFLHHLLRGPGRRQTCFTGKVCSPPHSSPRKQAAAGGALNAYTPLPLHAWVWYFSEHPE